MAVTQLIEVANDFSSPVFISGTLAKREFQIIHLHLQLEWLDIGGKPNCNRYSKMPHGLAKVNWFREKCLY
ncbi:hypothetical protein KHA80_15955 [Anaerobacillus sp. HL2]|nr:hypothetical protein KHA80_15955 [Anaerobacillus sp. HL2]